MWNGIALDFRVWAMLLSKSLPTGIRKESVTQFDKLTFPSCGLNKRGLCFIRSLLTSVQISFRVMSIHLLYSKTRKGGYEVKSSNMSIHLLYAWFFTATNKTKFVSGLVWLFFSPNSRCLYLFIYFICPNHLSPISSSLIRIKRYHSMLHNLVEVVRIVEPFDWIWRTWCPGLTS